MTKNTRSYTVEGRWPFPLDMLRHDDARGASQQDQDLITRLSGEFCPDDINFRQRYQVALQCPAGVRPNAARWASFQWKVLDYPRA